MSKLRKFNESFASRPLPPLGDQVFASEVKYMPKSYKRNPYYGGGIDFTWDPKDYEDYAVYVRRNMLSWGIETDNTCHHRSLSGVNPCLSLFPITFHMLEERGDILPLFVSGFNNPSLRNGYLPNLPREEGSIKNILYGWSEDDHLCSYIAFVDGDPYGYINFKLSDTTGSFAIDQPSASVWLTYGNLDIERGRRGIMSDALRLAILGVKGMQPFLKVSQVLTCISDHNFGSLKVASRAGFTADKTALSDPRCEMSSNIPAGGFLYYFKLSFDNIQINYS